MNQPQTICFNLADDFSISFSKEKTEIKIPRLTFKSAQKVIAVIANLLGRQASAVLKLVAMQMDNRKQSPDGLRVNSEIASTLAEQFILVKDYEVVRSLLIDVSEGVFTPEMIDSMQYGEAVGILAYLLDQNFASLKNLSASLDQIYSSVKTPSN